MAERTIYITSLDKERLEELIETARKFSMGDDMYLKELENELNRAKVVKPEDIPKDVITMNTKVRVEDLDTEEETTYCLVFPNASDVDQNKLSVLSPIGTALLGYRVGDVIKWKVPAGLTRLKIKKILYQPEAAGDYKEQR